MIELEKEWKFYQDKNGQWQWRKYVANKVVAVSSDGFSTKKECVKNAAERGYIVPPAKFRTSKENSTSGVGI